jgi:hypothetical protein
VEVDHERLRCAHGKRFADRPARQSHLTSDKQRYLQDRPTCITPASVAHISPLVKPDTLITPHTSRSGNQWDARALLATAALLATKKWLVAGARHPLNLEFPWTVAETRRGELNRVTFDRCPQKPI